MLLTKGKYICVFILYLYTMTNQYSSHSVFECKVIICKLTAVKQI